MLLVTHLPGLQGGSQGGIFSLDGCNFPCLQAGRGSNHSSYANVNLTA